MNLLGLNTFLSFITFLRTFFFRSVSFFLSFFSTLLRLLVQREIYEDRTGQDRTGKDRTEKGQDRLVTSFTAVHG